MRCELPAAPIWQSGWPPPSRRARPPAGCSHGARALAVPDLPGPRLSASCHFPEFTGTKAAGTTWPHWHPLPAVGGPRWPPPPARLLARGLAATSRFTVDASDCHGHACGGMESRSLNSSPSSPDLSGRAPAVKSNGRLLLWKIRFAHSLLSRGVANMEREESLKVYLIKSMRSRTTMIIIMHTHQVSTITMLARTVQRRQIRAKRF